MPKKSIHFGKLIPRYSFFLNPYADERFTRCPKCGAKTGQRKLPLLIHVEPEHFISLNYTCRYCSSCDLLIAHQDKIDGLLAATFSQKAPEAIGNDYLILGTVERNDWTQGTKSPQLIEDLPDHVHDFKQVLMFEPNYGWVKDEPAPTTKRPESQNRRKPLTLATSDTVDDIPQALALVARMKAHLPIRVRPTGTLIKALRRQSHVLRPGQAMYIRDLFYAGDEGGITCDVTPPGQRKDAVLCSLTHLEIEGDSPLVREIRAYQRLRSSKLARLDDGLLSFRIEPRSRKS